MRGRTYWDRLVMSPTSKLIRLDATSIEQHAGFRIGVLLVDF